MKTLGTISIALLLLLSCKKDKVPPPCTGVSMTGERTLFVGTWHWYRTSVEEWFDIGPSIYYDYTPQTEGFDYYFTISEDGFFKGYRNDVLVEDIVLSIVEFENFGGVNTNGMRFSLNCDQFDVLGLTMFSSNVTQDTILTREYPLNFDDQENHLKSGQNYFVKE